MRYSRLLWTHSSPGEPREILSEYDPEGWERRKVEMFADGSARFACEAESSGGSELSLIPCPPDEEVIAEPEFRVFEMTKEDFERAWGRARANAEAREGLSDGRGGGRIEETVSEEA